MRAKEGTANKADDCKNITPSACAKPHSLRSLNFSQAEGVALAKDLSLGILLI